MRFALDLNRRRNEAGRGTTFLANARPRHRQDQHETAPCARRPSRPSPTPSRALARYEAERKLRATKLPLANGADTLPSASATLRKPGIRMEARAVLVHEAQCVTGNASSPPNFDGSL